MKFIIMLSFAYLEILNILSSRPAQDFVLDFF